MPNERVNFWVFEKCGVNLKFANWGSVRNLLNENAHHETTNKEAILKLVKLGHWFWDLKNNWVDFKNCKMRSQF